MAVVPEWLTAGLALATLVVVVLIVVLARRSLAAVALAAYLAGLALGELQADVVLALGGGPALAWKLKWILSLSVSAPGMLAFAVVYPTVHVGRGRKAALVSILVLAAVAAVFVLLSPDRWWYDPTTGAFPATPFVGTTFGALALTVPVIVLGRRWLARSADSYRMQLAWGIIPIAWWALHDGLGYLVYPWLLGRGAPPFVLVPFAVVVWLNVLGAFAVLALMLVALWRTFTGRGARDDRALGFVILYLLPLTLVQLVLPWHHLLDYAIVPLAVYGVLRHRVVDIDIKVKHGLKRSTVAAAFLAVFLVATTITQEFLSESLGWLGGGVAAGLLLFALAPIQRVADQFSAAAFPNAREDAGYLTYRRYQIYRAALEGTVHDGALDPSGTSALQRLRQELGLTLDDHRLLESEVRTRLPPVTA